MTQSGHFGYAVGIRAALANLSRNRTRSNETILIHWSCCFGAPSRGGERASVVYGGALHPTAEGHAAMADAALVSACEVVPSENVIRKSLCTTPGFKFPVLAYKFPVPSQKFP